MWTLINRESQRRMEKTELETAGILTPVLWVASLARNVIAIPSTDKPPRSRGQSPLLVWTLINRQFRQGREDKKRVGSGFDSDPRSLVFLL
jgi:hypothetical protein